MATVQQRQPQQMVLRDVDWPTYTRLLGIFAKRPAIRLTYDRGTLETTTLRRRRRRRGLEPEKCHWIANEPRVRSQALPLVTSTDLAGFLTLRAQLDENGVVRQFRDWVRQQMGGPFSPAVAP
jgi:hypothetical protein